MNLIILNHKYIMQDESVINECTIETDHNMIAKWAQKYTTTKLIDTAKSWENICQKELIKALKDSSYASVTDTDTVPAKLTTTDTESAQKVATQPC